MTAVTQPMDHPRTTGTGIPLEKRGLAQQSLSVVWRNLLHIRRMPEMLMDVTIQPVMFVLLFAFVFGGSIAVAGSNYREFLLPGIMVQTIVFITVYTGVGLNTDIQKGLYDRFRSLPMWQPAPILGALTGDLFRYSVASSLIIGLGLILGFRPAGGAVGVLLAFGLVLVFAVSVSWIWIIFGMKVKTPESVMTTSFVFLMPLTFASNIFVKLETMPAWLQAIVRHNPVTHLTNASRALMHGTPAGPDVVWVLVASAVIVAIAAPIALRMYYQER